MLVKFAADFRGPMFKFLHVALQLTEGILWRVFALGVEGNEMVLSQKFADFVQTQAFLAVDVVEFIVLLFFVDSEGHHQIIELYIAEYLRDVFLRDVGEIKIRAILFGFDKKEVV
jgi:hypothetical protein